MFHTGANKKRIRYISIEFEKWEKAQNKKRAEVIKL
jgi:hypothetical protein